MQIRDRIKELRRVKASELRPNPRNWRTHPQAQQDALRGVLAEIGYADALLARQLPDGALELVDGHLRAETTPDMEVPVLVLDIDEVEAAKVLATLDPLAALAEADAGKLDALLREIDTGSEAVQKMLADLAVDSGIIPPDGGGQTQDPEPQIDRAAELQKEWGTERGQVWEVPGKAGSHRVMCGDSTSKEDVGRLMGGVTAGLCFTSPPYAQQRDYTEASKEHTANWDALMQGVFGCLPMAPDGQVLVNLGLIHRDGEWVPYWDGWIEWMRSQGWRRFGWYVWDQIDGLPGDWNGRLAPCFEFVFHFNRVAVRPIKWLAKNPGSIRDRTGDVGMRGDSATSQSWTSGEKSCQPTKVADSIVRVVRQFHPTVKGTHHPAAFRVGLPEYFVKSWPGSIYDPFLGSGTTMVAAENISRICYGCEIEPKYVAVILQRMKDMGLSPRLTEQPAESPPVLAAAAPTDPPTPTA